MAGLSIGDMAGAFLTRNHHARLKANLERLGTELTTGVTQTLRASTGGDLGALAGLEHGIGALQAYHVSAAEAALTAGALQRAMESVQDTTEELAPSLLQASNSGQATLVQVAASDARSRFLSVVAVLNTQVADRALLGGSATDGPALADAETMLADLAAATAAETTAAGIETAVDAWFDTVGGGFETLGYLGADEALEPFRVGPTETASLSLKADDPVLRDLLKSYAMTSLIADGALSGNHAERATLMQTAAHRMLTVDKSIAELRAGVGMTEARIDDATARNSAEAAALEMARSKLVSIDPYKAATDLASVQTQLESLYAITARLSRLSLAEYLR